MDFNISQAFFDLPDKYQGLIISYLQLFHEDTDDFHTPHLRQTLRSIYPLFIFLYCLIVVMGTVTNVCILLTIVRQHLHVDPIHSFMANLALSNIVQCVLVLPIALFNLLVQNWIFGNFLCYFIPMMHYVPIYASTLTFLVMVSYRYRLIFYPAFPPRIAPCLCTLGIWTLSICVVLPFTIFITYWDMGRFFPDSAQFEGVGMCLVNLESNMEEYLRWLFIALYVLPLTVVAFLHVRLSREIKSRGNPLPSVVFEAVSADQSESRSESRSGCDTPCPTRDRWFESERSSISVKEVDLGVGAADGGLPLLQRRSDDCNVQWRQEVPADDDQFDARKESRSQRYLILMVIAFAACLCPLEIIKLVKHGVEETYDNTGYFDLAYVILVWIGFLPTCITPILFASWFSSRLVKEKLRGYFRLGSHRNSSIMSIAQQRQQNNNHGHSNEAYVPNGTMVKLTAPEIRVGGRKEQATS